MFTSRFLISLVILFLVTWFAIDPSKAFIRRVFAVRWEAPVAQEKQIHTKTPPSSISFPTLDKKLIVSAGLIKNGEWDLYKNKVAWLATSAVPGEGNVILYAHNWKNLFGDLYKLQPGDDIILAQGNEDLTYKVREISRISPNEITAILSENNQLTLYTCDGLFDQKRLVVYAEPVSN